MANQKIQVECPRCGQKLRLSVTEKNFGREVEVTCSSCTNIFRTVIPRLRTHEEAMAAMSEKIMGEMDESERLRMEALMEEFGTALGEVTTEALRSSARMEGIAKRIREAGYSPFAILGAMIGFTKSGDAESSGEVHEPAPFVQNDKVVPGVFVTDDAEWLKGFKIKLDE
jgi:transcription elongation factor Elf1